MRVVLQRVSRAAVRVEGRDVAAIGRGLLLLVGIAAADTEEDARLLAAKIANLRIFGDEGGLLNRSLLETGGEILAVSQFTLFADWRKGRRPSFGRAAPAAAAEPLFARFVDLLTTQGIPCLTGIFGAMMEVELVNDGPVTLILDSGEEAS